MTPLSRLTLAAANLYRTTSPSPSHMSNPGRDRTPFLATRKFGFEPSEPTEPNPLTRPRRLPNEPINPLKTNKSDGFVPSPRKPNRRALPHQPPNLVHFLVRHRDTPLRPVA